MISWKKLCLSLFLLLCAQPAFAVLSYYRVTTEVSPGAGTKFTATLMPDGSYLPSVNCANCSGGGGGGGVVSQGPVDLTAAPWQFDFEQILGAPPSATNYLPFRLTNGTSYVDPTQIRALTFAGDKADVSGSAVSVSNFPSTQNVAITNSPTVTANIGTTNGLALDASVLNLSAKFGSLGQKLMSGSAPVVIASDQSAIPVTGTFFQATQPVSGNLGRTWTLLFASDKVDASGSSVSVSNFPASQPVTGPLTDTQLRASPVPVSGTVIANAGTNLNTSALALQSGANTYLDKNSSGSIAALNDAVTISTNGMSSVFIDVSGTWVGSLVFEGQNGSGSFYATFGIIPFSTLLGNFVGNGQIVIPVGGFSQFRVRANAWTSGSATVTINAGSGTQALQVYNLTPGNLANLASQGPANTAANGWPVKPTDGTNSQAYTAASEAKVSVTQPLPTGTNSIGQVTTNAGTNTSTASLATEATLAKLTQTQDSTSSTQSGPLVQGAVTTDQPAYTTGKTDPLSLTPRGGLRSKIVGNDSAQLVRLDFSTTNVTTAAYVQLVASTSTNINRLHIFTSSGEDFVLATGAAASEVDQVQIAPGGWEAPIDIFIASGTRLSIKSKSATASKGILLITGLK